MPRQRQRQKKKGAQKARKKKKKMQKKNVFILGEKRPRPLFFFYINTSLAASPDAIIPLSLFVSKLQAREGLRTLTSITRRSTNEERSR
jgi:hypothetical protein